MGKLFKVKISSDLHDTRDFEVFYKGKKISSRITDLCCFFREDDFEFLSILNEIGVKENEKDVV